MTIFSYVFNMTFLIKHFTDPHSSLSYVKSEFSGQKHDRKIAPDNLIKL